MDYVLRYCIGATALSVISVALGTPSLHVVPPVDFWTIAFHSGKIPDPYRMENDVILRNLSYEEQSLDFDFSVPPSMWSDSIIELKMEGIGDLVNISFNGNAILNTGNLFRRYRLSVKHFLKRDQPNQTLSFKFNPSPPYAAAQAEKYKTEFGYSVPPACPPPVQEGICHPNFLRSRQSAFGWDWGPAFPTMAVLAPVTLVSYSGCALDNLNVRPVRLHGSGISWRLLIDFDVHCQTIGTGLDVSFAIHKLNISFSSHFKPSRTPEQINVTFDVPQGTHVSLWFPNEYGPQTLYSLQAKLAGDSTIERKFGFRHVELVQDPVKTPNGSSAGLTFYLKVNGIPIFLKGSNWIPKDSFLSRVSCQTLKYYFEQMVAVHFNTIRVWGGGIYEQDCFYELADSYGILIWQDFMFASSLYPVNPAFLSNVRQEVVDQMKRLKSHPSILIWAGNNENEAGLATGWWKLDAPKSRYIKDYVLLYNATVRPIVEEFDGTRPFVLSSPSNGKKSEEDGGISKNPYDQLYGDIHFYDYNNDPWATTTYPVPRLASEFGFQSFPSIATLLTAMPGKDLHYFSEEMLHRQHHPDGQLQMLLEIIMNLPTVSKCANLTNRYEVAICLSENIAFESLIYLTQINQAMAVRGEVEHYRRMRSTILSDGRGLTMGALYWQLNDIWQAPSWASIDYFGRWKMLHYYAKDFFEPLMVSLYAENNRIYAYAISDLLESANDTVFMLDVLSWSSFSPVFSYNLSVSSIAPLKSKLIYKSPSHLTFDNKNLIAVGRLFRKNVELCSENVIFLSKLYMVGYKNFGGVEITRVEPVANDTLRLDLKADGVAPFVWLEASDQTEGVFSKNGFTMVSPTKSVTFRLTQGTNCGGLTSKSFSVRSLRDAYR